MDTTRQAGFISQDSSDCEIGLMQDGLDGKVRMFGWWNRLPVVQNYDCQRMSEGDGLGKPIISAWLGEDIILGGSK